MKPHDAIACYNGSACDRPLPTPPNLVAILLVDDDLELTRALNLALRREGYNVDIASHGTQASQQAASGRYDLLILDWMLPGTDGVDICRQVRSRGDSTPVLFLTAKDTIDDRVLGLDAGADDYLVKPFELRELLARVRARVRRQSVPQRLQADGIALDCTNQLVDRGGRTIQLSEKESQLLAYFMHHRGQVLRHDELHQQLWPGDRPNSNVLAALVRLLRRKLSVPGETELIRTVYGKGYRFGGDDL